MILARSTPCMGVKVPPSSSYVNARVRWLWMAIKNPLLFSIIWVGFRWCESRDSLNFMAFSGGFLDPPPPAHLLTPSCFGILKMFRWYISGPSSIYVWLVVLKFWNFKCFHTRRKYNFRLLLGSVLDATHWNVVTLISSCNMFNEQKFKSGYGDIRFVW